MRADTQQDGAAAIEMALVIVVFFAILGFIAPLGVIFYENVQLGRDAADVVRFASSRPVSPRTIADTTSGSCIAADCTVKAGFLPTDAQIKLEASRGRTGTLVTASGTTVQQHQADPANCPSGRRVTVKLSNTINLGVFGAFIPNDTQTVSATATSCEE